MLNRLDRGRFVVRDKHIGVQTEHVGSNHTVEGRRRLRGYKRRQPACGGEDEGRKREYGNVESRNKLEMGTEACR
jgi:hypothetical protein